MFSNNCLEYSEFAVMSCIVLELNQAMMNNNSAYTISIHSQCFSIVNLYLYKLAITLSRLQRSVQFGTHKWYQSLYTKWVDPVSITTDTQGQIKVLPPRTVEEIIARERERKARTTFLMALPEDHLTKFHKMTDAKEIWDAIKSRFKDCIKGMTRDSWGSLSFDDLYNNIRVFENDVKGSTASSSSTQNLAFVFENTSSDSEKEDESTQDYFVLPIWSSYTSTVKRSTEKDAGEAPTKHPDLQTDENLVDKEDQDLLLQAGAAKTSSTNIVNTASTPVSTDNPYDGLSFSDPTNPDQDDSKIPALEDIYKNPTDGIFTNLSYDDEGAVADFTNLEIVLNVSPIPTSRINSIHPSTLILGDPQSA
ncbi:hypothetical protein Tco_1324379, partial [Tanacetum coccineum]